MLGNDKFNQENYSIKSYFIERCKELANNQKAIRKSCKIRIAITISIVFIASKTFSQDKRYTYKVYDTYESKDTNTVDIKTINANENNRYFNFIGASCLRVAV